MLDASGVSGGEVSNLNLNRVCKVVEDDRKSVLGR